MCKSIEESFNKVDKALDKMSDEDLMELLKILEKETCPLLEKDK